MSDAQREMLDRVAFDELRDLLEPSGALERLVDKLATEGRSRLEKLREAHLHADAEAVRGLAHGLKGAASGLAGTRMANLCRDLERAPAEQRLALLERLDEVLVATLAALRCELASRGTA